MGNRPPVIMTFFGASLALGSALEHLLSPTTELVITGCLMKSTFHCKSNPIEKWLIVVAQNKRRTLQNDNFFLCSQLMRHPFIKLFHLSNLLQILKNCRMFDIELFSKSLVVVRGSTLIMLSIGCCHLATAGTCTPYVQGSHLLWKSS